MKSNTLSWQNKIQKSKILALLDKKKVILAPSDTVFGLSGIVSKEVFDEFNRLKGRNNKPFLILAKSIDVINSMVEMSLFIF